jgi:hypothetical protein
MTETRSQDEGDTASAIDELRYARNAYNSSVAAAEGFVSGRRVASLRISEKRLRDLLWDNRNLLIDLALTGR